MKIALGVPSWPPGQVSNGVVTYAAQLVPAMRRLGHKVFVLAAHKAAEHDDPCTIDLRRFESPFTLWQRAMFKLAPATAVFNATSYAYTSAVKELFEKQQLDVFEMEESGGWSTAASRLKLFPVVVRLHGPWFLTGKFNDPDDEDPWNHGRQKREGKGIQAAQLVTAPSAKVLQDVKRHYDVDLIHSRVIRNPIEAVADKETWHFNTSDNNSLLFVGRFDSLKGGDLVLHTFSKLAADHPLLTITFVGPDVGIPAPDGRVLTFQEFIRNNLPDWCWPRIKFQGQLNHSSVMSLRRKHFMTIIASQHEMMPYSVLEAMSVGCPIVATNVGGIPELIQDKRNGLLVPPQDVTAMTTACQTLLSDRGLAARLGRQARLDCRDSHGPDTIAKQTIAAYEETIARFTFSTRS